jgi:NADPH:quinone reductase-like Zn-dependent oxidoreductase
MRFEDAGATPEAFLTAHDALFTAGGLRPGWPVLIHAAGSGVSTAAIQLAKAAGAFVIGTSRTADKLARAAEIGLDEGILVERGEPKFSDAVKRVAPGGVPLVLDFVGAPYLAENLAVLAPRGRLIAIGLMGGANANVPLGAFIMKRVTMVGTNLRMRALEEKIEATQAFAREVLPLLARGRVKPIVDATLPLAKAREAHERMEKNETFGKILLVP